MGHPPQAHARSAQAGPTRESGNASSAEAGPTCESRNSSSVQTVASMFGQPGLPLIMAAAAASGAAAASRAVRNLVADRDVFLRTSVIGPLSSPWWEEQWYFLSLIHI